MTVFNKCACLFNPSTGRVSFSHSLAPNFRVCPLQPVFLFTLGPSKGGTTAQVSLLVFCLFSFFFSYSPAPPYFPDQHRGDCNENWSTRTLELLPSDPRQQALSSLPNNLSGPFHVIKILDSKLSYNGSSFVLLFSVSSEQNKLKSNCFCAK